MKPGDTRAAAKISGMVLVGAAVTTSASAKQRDGTTTSVLLEGGVCRSEYSIEKAFQMATGNKVNFVQEPVRRRP